MKTKILIIAILAAFQLNAQQAKPVEQLKVAQVTTLTVGETYKITDQKYDKDNPFEKIKTYTVRVIEVSGKYVQYCFASTYGKSYQTNFNMTVVEFLQRVDNYNKYGKQ